VTKYFLKLYLLYIILFYTLFFKLSIKNWSVNAENTVRQDSKANVSEGEDHNFFQIVNLNRNME